MSIAELARAGALLLAKTHVEYTELPTRSYLTRCESPRVPFRWTINPYRGCEFACRYCYARYTHEFMEFRDTLDFERRIFAKAFDARAFAEQLRRIDAGDLIALGTATDPYQPAERRFRVTRRMLEVFARLGGFRLGITTKGNLIAQDADLLAEVARRNLLTVSMTVTTTDTALARLIEPGAPRPDLRLRAVRTLSERGVEVSVVASPVLPGLTDSLSSLRRVAAEARANGAASFAAHPVFLRDCAWRVFIPFLERHYPGLAREYKRRLGTGGDCTSDYRDALAARVRQVRAEFGLLSRPPKWSAPMPRAQLLLWDDCSPGVTVQP